METFKAASIGLGILSGIELIAVVGLGVWCWRLIKAKTIVPNPDTNLIPTIVRPQMGQVQTTDFQANRHVKGQIDQLVGNKVAPGYPPKLTTSSPL